MKKTYLQDPPFKVKVEFTEGCNFRCTFCGIQGIREKPGDYKFMTIETVTRIAEEVSTAGWRSGFEMAMHGEPSINPKATEMIGVLRKALPRNQLMMTSNGTGFATDSLRKIKAIFEAGLNVLALDDYEGAKNVPRIREALKNSDIEQHEYPGELAFSPYSKYPGSKHMVVYFADISKPQAGVHNVLENHCGAAFPTTDKAQGKRCARPFREMVVRWNGAVSICCNDWRGVSKMGSVVGRKSIVDIWRGAEFTAWRKALYHGQRDIGACKGCDNISFRVGLLPDPTGQQSLPLPDATDIRVMKKAAGGAPLTQIVLRPWEVK